MPAAVRIAVSASGALSPPTRCAPTAVPTCWLVTIVPPALRSPGRADHPTSRSSASGPGAGSRVRRDGSRRGRGSWCAGARSGWRRCWRRSCCARARPGRGRRSRGSPGRSRCPRPPIPSAPPTTSSSRRTSRAAATSRRSTSSAARPTSTAGRRPARPSCARPTRRTRRGSSSAGPRRRSHFSGNVIVEMLNPSNLFDLNIGWATVARPVHAQRRRLGRHHGEADHGRRAQDVRPRALRVAVVRQPAAALRSRQLHGHPDVRGPAGAALAADRGRPRLGHQQPGRRVAQERRALEPARLRPRPQPGRARRTASATRRPAATSSTTSTRSTRASSPRTASRSTTATSSAWPAATSSAPSRSTSASPPRAGRSAAADPQRRRAGHPDHVPVGLPARDRRAARGRQHAARTASATTRWPAPRTRRRTSSTTRPRPADIVRAGRPVPPATCNEGPRSRFPSSIHFDAGLRNLDLWTRYGIPAPPGRQITWSERRRRCSTRTAT